MRNPIVLGLVAVLCFGFALPANAASYNLARTKQAPPLATPLPKFQVAACRFAPCGCHYECIRWDQNGNCVGTYRTCDTCSVCDDR
jgi:hypothetical protein